jgi:hypothetical protein
MHKKISMLVAASLLVAFFYTEKPVQAACEPLPGDKGLASYTVQVAEPAQYDIWLLAHAPGGDKNSVFVQLDSECPWVAGDKDTAQEFTWLNYHSGDTAKTMSVNLSAGEHILKIAGREAGASVDKILLAKTGSCTPIGNGENCLAAATTEQTQADQQPAPQPATAQDGINWWVIAACSLATLATIGFLTWKYFVFRKKMTAPSTPGLPHAQPTPHRHSLVHFWQHHKVIIAICCSVIIASLIVGIVGAAENKPLFEAESGSLHGGAKTVDNAQASGGKLVQFDTNPPGTSVPQQALQAKGSASSSSGSSQTGSTNNSGSSNNNSDGGGSPAPTTSYPARFSVGAPGVGKYKQSDASLPVPAGYTQILPNDNGNSNAYNLYTCGNITLNHVYIRAFIYLGTGCHGTVTITNSIIAPPPGSNQRAILVNADSSASLTINISDTTIRPEPVGMGGTNAALTDHVLNDCETCTISMNRVDVANSGGMCLCGHNTTVQNSWLHDSYTAHLPDPSVAHTGGVFPYGGSGPLTIRNNRLEPGVNAFTGMAHPDYWKAITAVLFTQASGGSKLRNYTVEGNFISLGAFDMGLEDGENLIIRNNVFGPNHWGYTTTCTSGCSVSLGEWSNNFVGDINGTATTTPVPRPF